MQDARNMGMVKETIYGRPKLHFIIGGAAAGKGGYVDEMAGTPLDQMGPDGLRKDGSMPRAPMAGHSQQRVHDCDRIKKANPLYTEKAGDSDAVKKFGPNAGRDGLGGPSGPANMTELDKYSPKARAAVAKHLKDTLGYDSITDFANAHCGPGTENGNEDGSGQNFGGGLTHEMSSELNKLNILEGLKHPKAGDQIINCADSDYCTAWADEALKNDFLVCFHYIDTAMPIATGV
ncbi:MAG: hypothetical protein GIX02_04550 [Candidatus Eremiobacteraeota bacterium]|nr:hypothetical protein [Candidatus Eremiobacteraeota bacterium]